MKQFVKKHLWQCMAVLCALVIVAGTIVPIIAAQKSDDYYENAETFFNECDDQDYHIEFANQTIYYAVRGKTAGSKNMLRYYTIGWQITAAANDRSMSVDVKRDGNYLISEPEVPAKDGYTYTLFHISYENIAKLMTAKDAATWTTINKSSSVTFYMDAIMSIKQPGKNSPEGDIVSEKGDGTVTFNGSSHVYYMRDVAQRNAIQSMFSGGLNYYYGLKKDLDSPLLTVRYNVGESGVQIGNGTYTQDDKGNILVASTGKKDTQYAYRFMHITLRDAYKLLI